MRQKLLFISSLILITILFSCSSGKKSFEKGNYDDGLLKAINRLRQSPNNKRAKETLQYGYPITLKWHKDNIERNKQSNAEFVHENNYHEYKKINFLADEIRRCPSCLVTIPNPESFISEQAVAAHKAAQYRYSLGDSLLSQSIALNDKTRAMDAYYHFETANSLVNGFSRVEDKMEEARWLATTKVVIQPIVTGSTMLDFSADFFYNKIQDHLQQIKVSPFVQFYTPNEASSLNINTPDQEVILRFDHFVVGQIYHKVSELNRSKDSVIIGTVKDSNGEKINVYGTVKAKMTINHKEVISKGLLDLKIVDPYTSRILTQEKLPGEYIWFTEWGNFNGDEKALKKSDWNIIRAKDVPPPPPQDLFIAFTQPIFIQVTSKLNSFYAAYK